MYEINKNAKAAIVVDIIPIARERVHPHEPKETKKDTSPENNINTDHRNVLCNLPNNSSSITPILSVMRMVANTQEIVVTIKSAAARTAKLELTLPERFFEVSGKSSTYNVTAKPASTALTNES